MKPYLRACLFTLAALILLPSTAHAKKDEVSLQSGDELRELRFSVRMGPRFSLVIHGPGDVAPSFDMRFARVGFRGYAFTKALRYRVVIDVARAAEQVLEALDVDGVDTNDDGEINAITTDEDLVEVSSSFVKQAYLEWRPLKAFGVRVGNFKVWDSLQRQASISQLMFPERALSTSRFDHGFDLGLALGGDVGKYLSYQASVTNGSGRLLTNDDNGLLYGLGVAVHPGGRASEVEGAPERRIEPQASIAAGMRFENKRPMDKDRRPEPGRDELGVSVGTRVALRGWSLAAEGFLDMSWDRNVVGTVIEENIDVGGFLQTGYTLPFGLEFGVRAGLWTESKPFAPEWEFTGGLSYYPLRPDGVGRMRDHSWSLKLAWTTRLADSEALHTMVLQQQLRF